MQLERYSETPARQNAAKRGKSGRADKPRTSPGRGVGRTIAVTSRILVSMDPEIPTSDYREIEELTARGRERLRHGRIRSLRSPERRIDASQSRTL